MSTIVACSGDQATVPGEASEGAPGASPGMSTETGNSAVVSTEGRSGKVTETMNAAGYTYLNVDTGTETFWAAAPAFAVEVGDPVVVPDGMPMQDFHSSALDRDFDVVYFVDQVSVSGDGAGGDGSTAPLEMPAGHPPVTVADADLAAGDIEVPEGARSVGEIIAAADELNGETVAFKGRVVKYNANIMGSNWLHVQDGTGSAGQNDLTVTTNDVVSVGDIVTVTGILATDKDFGAGYRYDVIVEGAHVSVD
ncbi:MAG: hypothetical protein KJO98_16250 [Rhodothermia bacterium]|nr:hypothetical protein [Rhodothermia bacterium]